MSECKEARLPEIYEYVRMHGVLIDVKNIKPPPPKQYKEYIFEQRCARKELRFKDGRVLQTLSTVNDFYGLGSSEEIAIEELIKTCRDMKLSKKSDVEAVVVREIQHFIGVPEKKPNFYDKTFFNFKLESCGTVTEEDIWSSKRGFLPEKKRVGRGGYNPEVYGW